jgi:hypothetical protein
MWLRVALSVTILLQLSGWTKAEPGPADVCSSVAQREFRYVTS